MITPNSYLFLFISDDFVILSNGGLHMENKLDYTQGRVGLIDTTAKLNIHLKMFKNKMLREGAQGFQLYPMFCSYYTNNKGKYQLPQQEVLGAACDILIG